jgi:hypothetical protein
VFDGQSEIGASVDRDVARRIAAATYDAEAALHAAVESLRQRVSDKAADACDLELIKVFVQVDFHILGPLWQEFPDLTPPGPERPADFDALRFRVSPEELAPVQGALARLRQVLHDLISLVESGAVTPGEQRGYLSALANIGDTIKSAETGLTELTGPASATLRNP